jgi:hypothetical protein
VKSLGLVCLLMDFSSEGGPKKVNNTLAEYALKRAQGTPSLAAVSGIQHWMISNRIKCGGSLWISLSIVAFNPAPSSDTESALLASQRWPHNFLGGHQLRAVGAPQT